jgi:ATP-binding cassette, subfamily B, bacterial
MSRVLTMLDRRLGMAMRSPAEVTRRSPEDRSRERRFRRLMTDYLWGARWSLALAFGCMLGSTLMTVLAPWPLKLIFDHVLLNGSLPSRLGFLGPVLAAGKITTVAVLSSLIIVMAGLQAVFAYGQTYLTSRIGYALVHALRHRCFAHLQQLSLAFYHRSRSGELVSKITADTTTLRDVFTDSVVTFAGHVLTLAAMCAVMFAVNWRLALAVLATLPLVAWTLFRLQLRIRASSRRQRREEGQIAARLTEMLASITLVQAFARERHEADRFNAEAAANLETGVRLARTQAVAVRSVEVLGALSTWVVVLLGTIQVLAGRMSPGDILIFAAYLGTMYKPVRQMAKLIGKFGKAAASAQRIAELLDEEPEIQDAPEAIDAPRLRGDIVFEGVGFDHGDGRAILEDVSFHIAPGQRAVILGASGAGKSTLASLLLRLYQPTAGRILLDGVDFSSFRRDSVRQQVGIVLQDSMLWGASVRENIAYGNLDATIDQIVAAARAANAHDFITELPEGYDTVIGERGASLSGGQRRRIAMARAIIRNAPILVLDEPMSGLDVESEAQVRDALDRITAGRTCLLITHDLREASRADVVLLVEGGRVVAHGRHRDLARTSLRYRRILELAAAAN